MDKHRYIHATVTAAAVDAFNYVGTIAPAIMSLNGSSALFMPIGIPLPIRGLLIPTAFRDTIERHGSWRLGGTRDDPAEVARVSEVVPRNGFWPYMEMQPEQVLEVAIGDWERPMTIFDLDMIRSTVQQVVDRFGPAIG